ncbi:inosine/xanthosine triphosphatase [Thermococcus pacificus]|uniref:Probable inosine/xanthosine triphosphatase n=1 Tax=Thermococcus pacificus TaxID=71998 RepID=A0A218P6E2_9EURY|nr:inosine/xanthosine triphosphatase [Thermococcus pacificus]ASJ06349.1 NTPase [Thermococcus pacificus]
MRIAVGSTNPTKVLAVKEVMEMIYGDVEVFGVEVESGVPDQPVGIEETIRGAINRARQALEKGNADMGVGIEAGIYPVPNSLTGYFDIQFCAILDREGWLTIGHGPGFEYPPYVIKRIKEGVEAGKAMDELVGEKDLKRKTGAIGYLTHGILPRKELNKLAVLMAMVPRMNPELFGLKDVPSPTAPRSPLTGV